MRSTRFASAVHILTELALSSNVAISSFVLASQLQMDGGTTRRLMLALSAVGLLRARPGPRGGARLGRPATVITLLQVRNAVDPPHPPGDTIRSTCPTSATSRFLPGVLGDVLDEGRRLEDARLGSLTIADIAGRVDRLSRERAFEVARQRRERRELAR